MAAAAAGAGARLPLEEAAVAPTAEGAVAAGTARDDIGGVGEMRPPADASPLLLPVAPLEVEICGWCLGAGTASMVSSCSICMVSW